MANHTIIFTTNGGNIDIQKTPQRVLQGDKVTFKSTNDAFEVEFDKREWPFAESEEVIQVPAGGTSAAYTVLSDSQHDEFDDYEVRKVDQSIHASGVIEIDN